MDYPISPITSSPMTSSLPSSPVLEAPEKNSAFEYARRSRSEYRGGSNFKTVAIKESLWRRFVNKLKLIFTKIINFFRQKTPPQGSQSHIRKPVVANSSIQLNPLSSSKSFSTGETNNWTKIKDELHGVYKGLLNGDASVIERAPSVLKKQDSQMFNSPLRGRYYAVVRPQTFLKSMHDYLSTGNNSIDTLVDHLSSSPQLREIFDATAQSILNKFPHNTSLQLEGNVYLLAKEDLDLIVAIEKIAIDRGIRGQLFNSTIGWRHRSFLIPVTGNFSQEITEKLSTLVKVHELEKHQPIRTGGLSLGDALQNFNVGEVKGLLENSTTSGITPQLQEKLDIICRSRQALTQLHVMAAKQGLQIDVFDNPEYWRNHLHANGYTAFTKLLEIDELQHSVIDEAQLTFMSRQHDENQAKGKGIPLEVVMEGAGPIGVMTAIFQFMAGADVTIFEKRADPTRTQIVRLTPVVMTTLKFILGYDEFHRLFSGKKDQGAITADGHGSIVICRLEKALRQRMNALIEGRKTNGLPGFEYLEGYEFKDSSAIGLDTKSGKHVVELTGYPQAGSNSTERTLKAETVIAAGGVKSAIKGKFIPNMATAIDAKNAKEKHYGTVSWLSGSIAGDDSGNDIDFIDFKYCDKSFLQQFKKQVERGMAKELSPEELKKLIKKIDKIPPLKTPMQMRRFENNGVFYMAVEIPQKIKEIYDGFTAKGKTSVARCFYKNWLQSLGDHYHHLNTRGITVENMDDKMVSLFPIQRQLSDVYHDHTYNGKTRRFFAGGDALVTPHFMSASGFTGGYAHIFELHELTGNRVESGHYDKQSLKSFQYRMKQARGLIDSAAIDFERLPVPD